MKGRFFVYLLALLTFSNLFALSAGKVFAVSTPTFPSCVNPGTGEILASYSDGTHGVPGDSTTYTGSDTVYKIDQDVILQCLCPVGKEGVQSNWWKASNLSENDIKVLQNEGWILVPNGLAWGLEDEKYLVKNIPFSCQAPIGGGHVSDGRSDGRTDSLGGRPQGQVLGFAFTGNMREILMVASLGLILIGVGLKINTKKK